jgi:broad specificity phosphatase PhoE
MAAPTSRDDAPAYMLRAQERRARQLLEQPVDSDEPAFMVRARARATQRALTQMAAPDAPPGRTVAFAGETVSPRELQYPEQFRSRLATAIDVRLIRHGQTQGYVTDGGLTALGHWQAHRKGQDLTKGLKEGDTVRIVHAPTARAAETAESLRSGIEQALSRYGIGDVTLEGPRPNDAFANFRFWRDGVEMDVTAAFQDMALLREAHERRLSGDRPGWMVELDRFYKIQAAGGDPITSWLSVPMTYTEPPAVVVRRHWQGIVDELRKGPANLKLYMCGHSGPLRALAAAAVGHDPGEPHNVEDVRIKVYADLEHAVLTYRGRGVELELPTLFRPSWFCADGG